MVRLLIAIVVGVVVAVGVTALVTNKLAHASDGTASNASIYQYGTR